MPEDKINSAGPEENDPPKNVPEDEISAEPEGKSDIAEPSMNDASSLSQDATGDGDITDGTGGSSGDDEELSQDEIDKALDAANGVDVETAGTDKNQSTDGVEDGDINIIKSKEFEDFSKTEQSLEGHNIDMLLDVTLPISIELGRTSMPIEDILNLGPGSVVELNRLAGEPVDLLVNDKLIARGEVVVVDENFGIRVTNMVSQEERLKSLI